MRSPASALCWLLFAGLAAGANAQQPYLVRDIDSTPLPASSSPDELLAAPGGIVMAASDEAGRELWRSDGTTAGTYRLADACADACSSNPIALGTTPSAAFFQLADQGRVTLWRATGNPGSATQLAGPHSNFGPPLWVPALGATFLVATSFSGYDQLLRVDPVGNAAEVTSADSFDRLRELTAFAGRLYFLASSHESGENVWVTDGTSSGTHALLPVTAAPTSFSTLVSLGRLLVFFEWGRDQLYIWSGDGTAGGFTRVVAIHPGQRLVGGASAAVWGNRLLFSVRPLDTLDELWVTDGSQRGTVRLTSLGVSADPHGPHLDIGVTGKSALLRLREQTHGSELWTSNGTASGTRFVVDLCPGPCSSNPYPIASLGKRQVFGASDGAQGIEPWITDGTRKGTRRLGDLCPGACDSTPQLLATLGNRILIAATAGPGRSLVWVTDGTPAGTRPLAETTPGLLTAATVENRVLFRGLDSDHGAELWSTDGTPAGTRLVRDLDATDAGGSFPFALVAGGTGLIFLASDGVAGMEPWMSDGTAEGTRRIAVVEPPLSRQEQVAAAGSRVVLTSDGGRHLSAADPADGTVVTLGDGSWYLPLASSGPLAYYLDLGLGGTYLCRTDGTVTGTFCLFDRSFENLTLLGGRAYFIGPNGSGRDVLMGTDGTREHTVVVADLTLAVPRPQRLVATGGRLFFVTAYPAGGGIGLWTSDGTPVGTRQLAVLSTAASAQGTRIVSVGPRVFVLLGQELWVVETASGAAHRMPTPTGSIWTSVEPTAVAQVVYFAAWEGTTGPVVWRSDGSDAGTYPLLDGEAQPLRSPWVLRSFAGKLVVGAAHGGDDALYMTDGTPAGTRVVMRVDRYASEELVVSGSRLYFAAPSADLGTELWALPDH